MESMVIARSRHGTHLTVFYRSSEVIRRLAADFAFLRTLLERVGVVPKSVHLHFAVAWIGMTFVATLLRTGPLIPFLDDLRPDRNLWMSATNSLARYLDPLRVPKYSAELREKRYFHTAWTEERREAAKMYLAENGR